MKKNAIIKLFLVLFLSVSGGYLLGLWLGSMEVGAGIMDIEKEQLSYVLPLFILVMIFILMIHELGHLLTGLMQGFRFEMFVTGFLGVKRDEEGRIRLFFNTDPNLFGGAAATSPTTLSDDNHRKFALTVIAGPLTSLVLAIILIPLSLILDQPAKLLVFTGGAFSFLIFLATTLPSRTGIFYTDRKRFQRLISKGKDRKTEMALMKAMSLQSTGSSLLEMTPEELQHITSDDALPVQFIGYYYQYLYYRIADPVLLPGVREELAARAGKLPRAFVRTIEKELGISLKEQKVA